MDGVTDARWLNGPADVDSSFRQRLSAAYHQLASRETPVDYHDWVSSEFGIDLSPEYAGIRIANPWGKASGQLSMTSQQVADDVAAGLGYVVLKTVIAESEDGQQSMAEWAIREARMRLEPITSRRGEDGWTVSWKGRGWWGTFREYLQLVTEARALSRDSSTLVVPSVKYHLPMPGETEWLEAEYEFTTRALLEAWGEGAPMPIEKDFSPTLAGSDRSQVRETVVEWLRRVPALVRGAVPDGEVVVGLKIFNALFDDAFQLELLQSVQQASPSGDAADWIVYGNRLFDPDREFDGHVGVAYGGPDLSDRNLRVLATFFDQCGPEMKPMAATGDINSGRMALEYAMRGASSFQLHTFFQLPAKHFTLRSGNRTQKALHELYLDPDEGLVVWLEHLARRWSLPRHPLRLADVVGRGRPD